MTDEATTTEEQATETQEKVEPTAAAEQKPEAKAEPTLLEKTKPPIVNADGTFHKDWRTMLPDELREEKSLETVTDFSNMAKQLVHHKKMVGANKVALPGENATPEEREAFYDAIGRPKTADDYQFDVPEDFQEIFTEERMAATRARAHKIGATQEQFATFMQGELEDAKKLLEWAEAEEAREKRDAEDALRKEFGGAYDERMHVANRIVAEAFPKEEERMGFLQEFGNNPKFVRFASIIGARLSESKAIVAQLTQDTPKEALKKIKELERTPGYLAPYRDTDGALKHMPPDQRQEVTERIRELYKQVYPEAAKANTFVGLG